MRGYLGRDDLTAGVMRDGWYVTGDIAALDADGFLRITDRLSRKGERLAVLHTLDEAGIAGILERIAQSGLPNLFIPRDDPFVKAARSRFGLNGTECPARAGRRQ